jgi:hypothetical protein
MGARLVANTAKVGYYESAPYADKLVSKVENVINSGNDRMADKFVYCNGGDGFVPSAPKTQPKAAPAVMAAPAPVVMNPASGLTEERVAEIVDAKMSSMLDALSVMMDRKLAALMNAPVSEASVMEPPAPVYSTEVVA